jgi:hypothetical protein
MPFIKAVSTNDAPSLQREGAAYQPPSILDLLFGPYSASYSASICKTRRFVVI